MSKGLNDVVPSKGEIDTLYVALKANGTPWVVGIGNPGQPGMVEVHNLASAARPGRFDMYESRAMELLARDLAKNTRNNRPKSRVNWDAATS